MKHGKHYVDAAKLVDSTKAYDVNEALELACKTCLLYTSHLCGGLAAEHVDLELHFEVLGINGLHKAHKTFQRTCGDPVSYTHLDVYKRQQ